MPDHVESKPHCFCLLGMQLCVLLFAGCTIGLVVLHTLERFFTAALLEYISVVTAVVFLLLLSFRMTTSRVISLPADHTERFPETAGRNERGESIEVEV